MAEKVISKIKNAAEYLQEQMERVELGIILGSGLGGLVEKITKDASISYKLIPHFPTSTVTGHEGNLISGKLENKNILVMQGRFHYYEGYDLQEVTFPIRVMAELGIKKLIITNAAGSINPKFSPGDLMLITDHINFCGLNPLRGPNIWFQGERFPDMSEAYNLNLIKKARKAALALNTELQEGIYAWMIGPSYETPAEIKTLSVLGADAVGMSTVPEVIVANHCGLSVLGISYITNMAAGLKSGKLNHSSVVDVAETGRETFQNFITKVVELI